MSGGVATTADANYCGPRLKKKNENYKKCKTICRIKNSNGYWWVFWVINGFEYAKVIVIE